MMFRIAILFSFVLLGSFWAADKTNAQITINESLLQGIIEEAINIDEAASSLANRTGINTDQARNIIQNLESGITDIDISDIADLDLQETARNIAERTGLNFDRAQELLSDLEQRVNSLNPNTILNEIANSAGIDISQAREVFESIEGDLSNLDFNKAVDLLDAFTNGEISGAATEALSALAELGGLNDLGDLGELLEQTEIVNDLIQTFEDLGPEGVIQQVALLAELAGGQEALEALIEEGAGELVDAIEDIAPALVQALGGEEAFEDAIEELVGEIIALTPVNTSDPGICTAACQGDQDKNPPTVGGGCSFCQGVGSQCSGQIRGHHQEIRTHMTNEFVTHRQWLENVFWSEHILPALTRMNIQLSATAIQQIAIIGKFFDAKHQLEVQRTMQALSAEAYKDYTPSEGLCEVGSNIRSLASSERLSDLTHLSFASRQLDRNIRAQGTPGSRSANGDKENRRTQFIRTYCNISDNGTGLNFLCRNSSAQPENHNKDINYTRSFLAPLTINMNIETGGTPTQEQEDVFALSANLYAHDILPAIAARQLADGQGRPLSRAYDYMNLRSIIAKRSVASNSFAAIIGLKTNGDEESAPFVKRAVIDLGFPESEIDYVLGEKPSYYAQMEVISKKIYQNPAFFTELYDKPTNVRRKGVMIRAVNLMQDRDIYDSLLRSEAILAVTLETMLEDQSERVSTKLENLPVLVRSMETIDR